MVRSEVSALYVLFAFSKGVSIFGFKNLSLIFFILALSKLFLLTADSDSSRALNNLSLDVLL